MAAALSALALGAIGAPAGAAVKNIAIVQGIPGKVADLCIDGKEVKSGFRYGRIFFKSMGPGGHRIKFYAKDPRTCRGIILAYTSVTLAPGADMTIVATKKAPKFVVFDNAGLGVLPAVTDVTAIARRHAADVGGVLMWSTLSPDFSPIAPTATDVFQKGDEAAEIGPAVDGILWHVAASASANDLFAYTGHPIDPNSRNEFILVGTSAGNSQFVWIVSPILPNP